MGILDDLDSLPPSIGGHLCGVAAALRDHPDVADDIQTAVEQRLDRPSTIVSKWARSHGINLSPGTIQRHRRGECRCG